MVWTDFGFSQKPCEFSDEIVLTHMNCCAPIFRGLNDGKFYYCHVQWGAEKSKLYDYCMEDSIELSKLDYKSEEDKIKCQFQKL